MTIDWVSLAVVALAFAAGVGFGAEWTARSLARENSKEPIDD